MFSRIRTPEDMIRCHVAIVLDLDESYLGGICNMACKGIDKSRWCSCVCKLKPDYRNSNHTPSYGYCLWDDQLTQEYQYLGWMGCVKHDQAHIRGPCTKHKCQKKTHKCDNLWCAHDNTCTIWTDMQGDCHSHYMIKGDEAVYTGWRKGREVIADSLPEYLERISTAQNTWSKCIREC